MLWINGHTGWLGQVLGFMPPPGKDYWAHNNSFVYEIVDAKINNFFINANDFFFSSSKRRFRLGYEYARDHFLLLFEHYLENDNSLKIIAHSQGVAFAEGLAAYLYNEKCIQVDEAYFLQGNGLGTIPQVKEAIKFRVVLKTIGDKIANKWNEDVKYADVVITEKCLKSGFCKYNFYIHCPNGNLFSSIFIQKGKLIFMREHTAHRLRQFQLWNAISHGKNIYKKIAKNSLKTTVAQSNIENLYHLNYN